MCLFVLLLTFTHLQLRIFQMKVLLALDVKFLDKWQIKGNLVTKHRDLDERFIAGLLFH